VSAPQTNGGNFAGLFTDDGTDDPLDEPGKPPPRAKQSKRVRVAGPDRFIGCPFWYFKLAVSISRTGHELAVALYIYRLRMVQRSRTVSVSNERLFTELGINRFTKYRALQKLADAGAIRIRRRNKRTLVVVFTGRKRGSRQ
jgi:hypothetical protein